MLSVLLDYVLLVVRLRFFKMPHQLGALENLSTADIENEQICNVLKKNIRRHL